MTRDQTLFALRKWGVIPYCLLTLFCQIPLKTRAQQKAYGNIYIPSGGLATIFGTQDFAEVGGKIVTEKGFGDGILNVAEGVEFINTSSNNFVNGTVRKLGESTLIFPTGDGTFYGPFSASADGTVGSYVHSNPSTVSFPATSKQSLLAFVSNVEFWNIEGSNTTRISLTWNAASQLTTAVHSISSLVIVGWKNGMWTEIPSSNDATSILGGISSLNAGSITSSIAIRPDDFEAFTIGAKSESLPVTLTGFSAKKELSTAILSWITTSETNSKHFQIERSSDGENWQNIGIVESLGESSDRHRYSYTDFYPSNGLNYYRLKMVDSDGSFALSLIESLDFDSARNVTVYPNPAASILKVQPLIKDAAQRKKITVTDLNGRNFSRYIKWNGDDLNIEKLENGIYVLMIPDPSGNQIQAKFVIQK